MNDQLTHPDVYRAYLLRLWRTDNQGWQASLQAAATELRIGFSSLEELFAYLLVETEHGHRPAPSRTNAEPLAPRDSDCQDKETQEQES